MNLKKITDAIEDFLSDNDDPNEPGYDPVHVGAMLVIVFVGLTVLFWMLWSLLVFGGGIQAKIIPFLTIVLTSKTVGDYGYVGYPYEMGIFQGWVTNITALVFTILIVFSMVFLFKALEKHKKGGAVRG